MNVSAPYGQWKAGNPPGSFSRFDYAHCVMREGQISGDLAIAFARLIWPKFVEVDGLIFLADQYSEEKASSLRAQGILGRQLEYWMNLFSVDGFFEGIEVSTQEHEEHLQKHSCLRGEGSFQLTSVPALLRWKLSRTTTRATYASSLHSEMPSYHMSASVTQAICAPN